MANLTTAKDKLYALYYMDDKGQRQYFYAGRSFSPEIRFKAHLRDREGAKGALIQKCRAENIELDYEVFGTADSADAEYKLYWDLHNKGFEMLNAISTNTARAHEHLVLKVSPCQPLELSDLSDKSKWVKIPTAIGIFRNVKGWRINIQPQAFGDLITIKSDVYPDQQFKVTGNKQAHYIAIVARVRLLLTITQ